MTNDHAELAVADFRHMLAVGGASWFWLPARACSTCGRSRGKRGCHLLEVYTAQLFNERTDIKAAAIRQGTRTARPSMRLNLSRTP